MKTYNALYVTGFSLSSETILVNRGWVPRNKLDARTRPEGQVSDTIELIGIVRPGEARPQFTPKSKGANFLYRYGSIKLTHSNSFDVKFNILQGFETNVRVDRS